MSGINQVQITINDVSYDLVLNQQTGMHEGEVKAPSESSYNLNGHYYPIKLNVLDNAGNRILMDDKDMVFGEKLRIRVKEITKPVITIISPTEDQRTTDNTPTAEWNVVDSGSGINPESISIIINNGQKITEGITKRQITNGYHCTYVIQNALSDGTNSLKCDVDDYDGNQAIQRGVTFIVDTVPPELSVAEPVNNLITNKKEISVIGTVKDKTSSPVIVKIKVNKNESEQATVATDGSFVKNVQLQEGENTVVVEAIDSAGKTSIVTRSVTVDTVSPVIENITVPESVNVGELFKISVVVTD